MSCCDYSTGDAMSGHTPEPDWKNIALELSWRVKFALTNCSCNSEGILNTKTMKATAWRDYMAEALEMIPGVVVDREILATLHLPLDKRKKAQAALRAKRAEIAKATGGAA